MIHSYDIEIINEQVHINAKCPACKKTYSFVIPAEDTNAFLSHIRLNSTMLIQHVLPHADDTVREHLISGFCKKCQDEFFNI